MPYRYRVTVENLAADGGGQAFEVTNHDEILGLVERVAARGILPAGEVTEFTVGLKLFSEIMLRHRREPLFAELFPHFGTFMKRLKGDAPNGAAAE